MISGDDVPTRHLQEEMPPHYELSDQSERLHVQGWNIADFEEERDLGRSIEVNILVKWTNQTYHDENLRAMSTPNWDPVAGISRANAWRHRNRYYDGLIVQASLGTDHLAADSVGLVVPTLQPTGIDTRSDGLTAFACADKIMLAPNGNPNDITETFGHPTFARLHSVEFSPDGQRLLTASSSLDLVHEIGLQGNILWTFDLWEDTPFNTNRLGQTFFRSASKAANVNALHNPDAVALKDNEDLRGAACVVDDPTKYDRLGLPTNLTPVFINTASYHPDGRILTTSFHRGEAWIVDREARRITVVAKGMKSPHGLHVDPLLNGLIVTDTGNEKVRFIDGSLSQEVSVSFWSLRGRKPGLDESRWLQYVSCLGKNLYCAIIAPRQALTLFDPIRKVRRDVPFDPEWGVQLVTAKGEQKPKNISALGSAAVFSDIPHE